MRLKICCCASIALFASQGHEGLLPVGADYSTSHTASLNFTLFGAVIISDKKAVTHQMTCASIYQYDNISIRSVLANRKSNAKELMRQLKPLKLQYWPTVHTRPCPISAGSRKAFIERPSHGLNDTDPVYNEQQMSHHIRGRGCLHNSVDPNGWSHLQIWLDFVFFDPDVLSARKRRIPEYLTHR